MRGLLRGLVYLWAVRPRSDRALARIARRNAADPRMWEEIGRGFAAALRALSDADAGASRSF
jgi:hypothetical protein